MSFKIGNTGGMQSTNFLQDINKSLSQSLEKLSSGRRINNAADDASGMSIANSLGSQARSAGQAMRNANDAIAMVQISAGALDESVSLIQTIREKALQAANGSQTTETRQALQSDIDKSLTALNDIATNTSYNGQKLLSGNFSDKSFQIGTASGETVNVSIGSAEAGNLGNKNGSLADINVLTAEGAQQAIEIADAALANINETRSNLGSTQNQLESSINNLATSQVNLFAAESQIRDVDFAEESMNFAKMKSLSDARVFASAQTNQMQKSNILNLLQG
jgi:flagellin